MDRSLDHGATSSFDQPSFLTRNAQTGTSAAFASTICSWRLCSTSLRNRRRWVASSVTLGRLHFNVDCSE